jgi:hypothetical protein
MSLTTKGAGTTGGGVLTPPTLAPVLAVACVDPLTTPNVANLTWSPSNKTSSPGFGYRIYRDVVTEGVSAGFVELGTTTFTVYDDVNSAPEPAGETYTYYIEPYNDAGPATGGGLSNEAGVVLPGETEAPILSGPSSVEYGDPTATLVWTAIPGATFYSVQSSLDDISYSQIDTPTAETYDVTVWDSPTYYKVIPFAGAVEGLESNVFAIYVTTPPPISMLELNAGGNILLNAGGAILIN